MFRPTAPASKGSSLLVRSLAVAPALALLAACSGEPVTGPTPGPSRVLTPQGVTAAEVAITTPKTLTLCKSGPAGTYTFAVSRAGNVNAGDTFLGVLDNAANAGSVSITVVGGTVCREIYRRTQTDATSGDALADVTAVEQAAPGTLLADITWNSTDGAPAPTIDKPNRSIVMHLNAFHSGTATFVNVAESVRGCTYTQGWYKNKGAGTLPQGEFYQSGQTRLQVLDTPPKGGNPYYQLAHQFIAATQNRIVASGTAAVDDALAKADTYFKLATPTNATPAPYTKTQLEGWANTLDAYNNGVTGPGHCK